MIKKPKRKLYEKMNDKEMINPKRKFYEKMKAKELKEISEQYQGNDLQPSNHGEADRRNFAIEIADTISQRIPIENQLQIVDMIREFLHAQFTNEAKALTEQFEKNQEAYEIFKRKNHD